MVFRLLGLIVGLIAWLAPADLPARQARPCSILVLDQSDMRSSFYDRIFWALQTEVEADPQSKVTIYAEDLDLFRFRSEEYRVNLRQTLRAKYRDKAIGVLVVVGSAALELALKWRDELWPGVPIVFTMVDEADFKRLNPPSDVTGNIVGAKFVDSVNVARKIVPDLATVYVVGDAWNDQIVLRNWKDELASVRDDLRVVELMGLPMTELRQRVSALPEHSAIVYASMHSDGEGGYFASVIGLARVAEKANRPIVVAADALLPPGGIGGYVLIADVIGTEAGRLTSRILNGEQAADITPKVLNAAAPIFNWQQMQRWNVAESDLPPGSEIRFRRLSPWERYRWQTLIVAAVILIQAALISILLHERKRRSSAEQEASSRLSELAHVGRQAAAGELSSSIAHELNQPLGAILANAETAELILQSSSPDLTELKAIVSDIRRDDQRASEVIHRMRSFLRRGPFELRNIDLNDVVRETFDFLAMQAASRNVALYFKAFPETLPVRGDAVQLQQVILNLVVNSMEAMSAMPYGRAVIGRTELNGGKSAIVSISDSGPGIPSEKLAEIFDPFFTTKQLGMGIGLSIARTIVQAHKGRIWAENQIEGGAIFRLSMPLSMQ
jgi:signal transduction histidine kinase